MTSVLLAPNAPKGGVLAVHGSLVSERPMVAGSLPPSPLLRILGLLAESPLYTRRKRSPNELRAGPGRGRRPIPHLTEERIR
jgi:hypothetical protein